MSPGLRVVAGAVLLSLVASVSATTVLGSSHEVEVRIAAQRHDDGRTEFALQVRGTDGRWGERALPSSRFLSADPALGRWLASSPLTVRVPGASDEIRGAEVRIAAQRHDDGRTEFALQVRGTDDKWGERILPSSRFFPAELMAGRWLASSPLTVRIPGDAGETAPSGGEAEVRIAARLLDDGRTEFALQIRGTDGEWSERVPPSSRFLPAEPAVGRWFVSSPLIVRAPDADEEAEGVEVRIAAQRLSDGRTEFALQRRGSEGAWGERVLPRRRFFPAEPTPDRWITSSPLKVTLPVAEPDAEPEVGKLGHSRTRPVPAGTTVETAEGLGITIVSATLDATSIVLGTRPSNEPPADGNRFTIVRVRIQNLEGLINSDRSLDGSYFRLVGSSATVFTTLITDQPCGVIPDALDLDLFKGGSGEGNVCFETPATETDLVLFYEPRHPFDRAGRRWLEVADPQTVEPLQPVEVPLDPGLEETRGHFRTNPIPPGETISTPDGLGVTVVSVTPDATSIVLDTERPDPKRYNDPPADGNRFTIVRVRIQSLEGSVNKERFIGGSPFRLVGSSATEFSTFSHFCGYIPDSLSLQLFKGGAGEGNVCFETPATETDLVLFYQPSHPFNRADRRWLEVANPQVVVPVQPVEISLEPDPNEVPGHFRTNPVPPGETVSTPDGMEVAIVSATLDATSIVLDTSHFNDPPADGNRFTMIRVRVQNLEGSVDSEVQIDKGDFHLVGSSATLFSAGHDCGQIPDPLFLGLFKGGAGEGNLCFEIPATETDLVLFYEPYTSLPDPDSDGADRRWLSVPSVASLQVVY